MSGLVLKDLLVLRKQGKAYLMMGGFYALLTLIDAFDYTIMSAMLVVMIMMMPMATFSYDDLARWDKYAAAMPVGRRGIVKAKYVTVLVISVGTSLFYLILCALLLLIKKNVEFPLMLAQLLACLGVALVMNAFSLPLMLKYGAEKSRGIFMGAMLAACLLIFGAAALVSQGSLAIPKGVAGALPWLLAVLAVGGFIASYFIAQRLYAKKEL